MQWHIANILTVSRLVMVPVFITCFVLHWYVAAFFAFGVASFTDLIDGTVARVLNKPSDFGALLDPIADKSLMISTFACLTAVRVLPVWFLVLVILRDVMIMGGIATLKYLKITVKYEPFWSSKIATLSQMTLGLLSLAFLGFPSAHFGSYPIEDFIMGAMFLTTLLLVVSGLQYIRKGIEILQSHDKMLGHRP